MCIYLARGAIRSISATRFTGEFTLDKSKYLINGSFTHNLPPFASKEAMMVIANRDALSGTRFVEGSVGCDRVVLKLGDSGNLIDAALDVPVCPGQSVSGVGVFSEAG